MPFLINSLLVWLSNNVVGIGTTIPRAKLDIEGGVRFKTYSEHVEALDISSNVVTIDLSLAQSFTLTADDDVNSFTITGASEPTLSVNAYQRSSAADVDAVRFAMSSGNIASGTFTAYGMVNS